MYVCIPGVPFIYIYYIYTQNPWIPYSTAHRSTDRYCHSALGEALRPPPIPPPAFFIWIHTCTFVNIWLDKCISAQSIQESQFICWHAHNPNPSPTPHTTLDLTYILHAHSTRVVHHIYFEYNIYIYICTHTQTLSTNHIHPTVCFVGRCILCWDVCATVHNFKNVLLHPESAILLLASWCLCLHT